MRKQELLSKDTKHANISSRSSKNSTLSVGKRKEYDKSRMIDRALAAVPEVRNQEIPKSSRNPQSAIAETNENIQRLYAGIIHTNSSYHNMNYDTNTAVHLHNNSTQIAANGPKPVRRNSVHFESMPPEADRNSKLKVKSSNQDHTQVENGISQNNHQSFYSYANSHGSKGSIDAGGLYAC